LAAVALAHGLQGAEDSDQKVDETAHVVQERQAAALLRRAIQGAAGDKAGVRAAARTLAGGMGFMRVPGTVVKGTLTAH
jgi:hypothetical protein